MEWKEEFWQELYKKFKPRLANYIASVLLPMLKRDENPGYAEDIVNETFAAAYMNFDRFDSNRGKMESWLFQIAKNKTYDFLRNHEELVSETSLWPNTETNVNEPEFLYEKEAKRNPRTLALLKALKKLSRYDQELLMCRLGNGLNYEEIERYFNFTVKKDTLRVHVNRAEARLRRELAKMPEFAQWFGE